MPIMCGVCPFFLAGREDSKGFCTAFDKHKGRYAHIPKRCSDLFEKAFQIGDDDYVIVIKK